jgi:transcriptional regulator with XRE-family HTH domain
MVSMLEAQPAYDSSDPLQVAQAVQRSILREITFNMLGMRLTQSELAEELGRTQQWVNRRMTGEVAWTAAELVMVADILNVSVSDLVPRLVERPKGPGGGDGGSSVRHQGLEPRTR